MSHNLGSGPGPQASQQPSTFMELGVLSTLELEIRLKKLTTIIPMHTIHDNNLTIIT